MQNTTIVQSGSRALALRSFAAMALLIVTTWSRAATDPSLTGGSSSGDGWQLLSGQSITAATVPPQVTSPTATTADQLAVAPVVLPGNVGGTDRQLTLTITPQDLNLRNALDRWLQTQGWQLAWKIDDDLPLEFNATFTGDFTSVLTQVMRATNHMRTPTRICRHTNNVIRVIARAGNCKD